MTDHDLYYAPSTHIIDRDTATTLSRRCGCGAWTGERCGLVRPLADLVTVEVIPEHLRASHEAAGNRGSYPHNGADRALVAPACADDLLAEHGEWARIV